MIKRFKTIFFTVILSLISSFHLFSQGAEIITGVWLTQDKDAHVKVYLAKNGKYYGQLVWMKDPLDEETGKPSLDKENPDEALRSRPLEGLIFMTGFTYDSEEKEWIDGKAYDPQSGKTYKAAMWMEEGKLKMRGYWGLFYRTETWTRIE